MARDQIQWETLQRIVRINHNRQVRKWFKDTTSTNVKASGRSALKNSLLIDNKDSVGEVQLKIMAFEQIVRQHRANEAVVAVPDTWQLKANQNRPQLVIVYRARKIEYITKSGRRSKTGARSICVPHYEGGRSVNAPNYTAGNEWARMILTDNSRIQINARSRTEAERVVKTLARMVSSRYRTDNIATGTYAKNLIRSADLVPAKAAYYSDGDQRSLPDWVTTF